MIAIQYIRASMLLISWDGLAILTDPWFGMHMRGLPVFVKPCRRPEDLPPLDLILVSHLHSDHYDRRALRRLSRPCQLMIGPPGLERRVGGVRCDRIVILEDGQTHEEKGFSVHAFSVEHSGYENAYVFRREGASILFAGDARPSPAFEKIGNLYQPLVSMLPVGGTEILGHRIVMNPEDAMKAATELRTKVVVPIHPGGEWLSVPPLSRHPGRAAQLASLAQSAFASFAVAALMPGQRVRVDNVGRIVGEGERSGRD